MMIFFFYLFEEIVCFLIPSYGAMKFFTLIYGYSLFFKVLVISLEVQNIRINALNGYQTTLCKVDIIKVLCNWQLLCVSILYSIQVEVFVNIWTYIYIYENRNMSFEMIRPNKQEMCFDFYHIENVIVISL